MKKLLLALLLLASPAHAFTIGFSPTATPNADGGGDNGYILGSQFRLSAGGTVKSMSVYIATTFSGNLTCAIYDSTGAGGGPGQVQITCPSTAIAANGWMTIPVTPTYIRGGVYWLMYQLSSATVNSGSVGVLAWGNIQYVFIGAGTWTYNTWTANPSSTNTFGTTATYGVYATLTGGGGETRTLPGRK